VSSLERRYRRWMVTYPAAYRRERESEILGTLLEAARPGQERPSVRESAALLVGGLRTGARLAARTPGRLWADGLRLGVLLVLIRVAALLIGMSLYNLSGLASGKLGQSELWHLETAVVSVGVIALALARFRLGLCVVVALALLEVGQRSAFPWIPPLELVSWVLVLIGSVLASLAWHRSLRPVSHAWPARLIALVVGAVVLQTAYVLAMNVLALHPPPPLGRLLWSALVFVPAAGLILLAVSAADPRPALAASVYVAADLVGHVQGLVGPNFVLPFPWSVYYQLETVADLLVAAGALALTVLAARRLAGPAPAQSGSSGTDIP
jgi:hypothetical protein